MLDEPRLTLAESAYHRAVFADDRTDLPAAVRALDGVAADTHERLTESTRLRRELGFEEGTAANLVGLAYLAAQQDRRDDAARYLDEGDELASRSAAVAVSRQLAQARRNLGFEREDQRDESEVWAGLSAMNDH